MATWPNTSRGLIYLFYKLKQIGNLPIKGVFDPNSVCMSLSTIVVSKHNTINSMLFSTTTSLVRVKIPFQHKHVSEISVSVEKWVVIDPYLTFNLQEDMVLFDA